MGKILNETPETYGPLIQRSFLLYRLSLKRVLPFSLILAIIIFIPRISADILGRNLFINLPLLHPIRLIGLIFALMGIVFFIAILWHMHCEILKVHEPAKQDLTLGMKKLFNVFIAILIQTLIISFLVFICVEVQQYFYKSFAMGVYTAAILIGIQSLLVLYATILFVFLCPLIVIENYNMITALSRSAQLVWNHWLRTITLLFFPWLVYFLILVLVKSILQIDLSNYFMQPSFESLWITLINIVIFAFFIPWVAALLLIQLNDLEQRKIKLR